MGPPALGGGIGVLGKHILVVCEAATRQENCAGPYGVLAVGVRHHYACDRVALPRHRYQLRVQAVVDAVRSPAQPNA